MAFCLLGNIDEKVNMPSWLKNKTEIIRVFKKWRLFNWLLVILTKRWTRDIRRRCIQWFKHTTFCCIVNDFLHTIASGLYVSTVVSCILHDFASYGNPFPATHSGDPTVTILKYSQRPFLPRKELNLYVSLGMYKEITNKVSIVSSCERKLYLSLTFF